MKTLHAQGRSGRPICGGERSTLDLRIPGFKRYVAAGAADYTALDGTRFRVCPDCVRILSRPLRSP